MSLITRIRDAFTREAPRALRNKAGGMAWVKGVRAGLGEEALNNAAVMTVRLTAEGYWEIRPKLQWLCKRDVYDGYGSTARAGETATTIALPDELLEPWKDIPESDLVETDVEAPNRTKEPV